MAEAPSLAALASRFVELEALPRIETAPGNRMKVIYHDPATDMLTILAKLEPGAGIPAHVHEDLEQTFVLEGSLVDQEGECSAGNFVIRAKGSRHAPTAPKGCTMLVFFLKPTAGLKKALLSGRPGAKSDAIGSEGDHVERASIVRAAAVTTL